MNYLKVFGFIVLLLISSGTIFCGIPYLVSVLTGWSLINLALIWSFIVEILAIVIIGGRYLNENEKIDKTEEKRNEGTSR